MRTSPDENAIACDVGMFDIRFSVVIPVYNGETTIERAIDSVLAQSYPACEVVVVDDGSTDGTASVLRKYGNKIRYLYKDNAGVSAARNYGVLNAVGEWLAFLDADDWYYQDRLLLHASFISDYPELDFLTGNFDYVDSNCVITKRSMESNGLGKKLLKHDDNCHRAFLRQEEFGEFVSSHFGDTHTLSVRKKTFTELGGYPTQYRVCEDVFFLIRLCTVSQLAGVITIPMAAYFIHEGSATRSNPVMSQCQTVRAMESVASEISITKHPMVNGVNKAVRNARMDLAYVLLKDKKKFSAISAVLPLIYKYPSFSSVKDVLSIMKSVVF